MIFKKILSILKWVGVMLMPLLAFITAPFTYPTVYLFRNIKWVRENSPFWFWFDDEDGYYGADYWRKEKGITKDNFWTSYRWSALRNPMWNLHTILKPRKGEEVYLNQKGNLTRNNVPLALSNVAVMHFEDENGNWIGNTGKILSLKYSVIGKVFIWFTIKDTLYWRYSLVKNLFGSWWIEIQLGVGYRYTFRFKTKKVII
jgi:hypothetical protein